MSTLSSQVNFLRLMARLVRDYDYEEISRMLREAADTIEGLRDRLQELQDAGGESRYSELFGTPERAARTLENGSPLCDWCDTNACEKRGGECSLFDYDALLEWLRGDA